MKKLNAKQTIVAVLSIVSALLLVMVIILSCALMRQKKNNDIDYFSSKVLSFAMQNLNLSKGQIVFVGDSHIDLCALDNYYQDLSLATYNRGIGGDTTQGVLNRLDVSVFDIAPKAVVLMIGTNDVNFGIPPAVYFQNYENIVRKIYENLPGVKLYLVSTPPLSETIPGINVLYNTKKIVDLNLQIRYIATSYGATFVNLFANTANEKGFLIADYTSDNLHLNHEGYLVLSSLLKPLFKADGAME
ncbi:MAG: hypothetical protein J6V66_07580 [Clostridia bacterium]|nr:hypothetical protein [Clostridia bacterium]